jgi:predicted nucleic acid-binding protein
MKICADSCFLIAIYDETDTNHGKAVECFTVQIERGPHTLVIPWPVLYESISTRMVRAGRRMTRIDTHFKSLRATRKLDFLDDHRFRDRALSKCFSSETGIPYHALSLVDRVIHEMLMDRSLQTQALATFNVRDFREVCAKFRKKILPAPLTA